MGIPPGVFGTAISTRSFLNSVPLKHHFRHFEAFLRKKVLTEFLLFALGKSCFRALCVSLRVFFGTEKMITFNSVHCIFRNLASLNLGRAVPAC